MPFFLRRPLLTIPRLFLLPPLRPAPPPMLPLGESGVAISCFLCGLRVWVGAGAGKLRARTGISISPAIGQWPYLRNSANQLL